MTADAKVGLLLGLVFIVIIAFLVNGLPNYFKRGEVDVISKDVEVRLPNKIIDIPLEDYVPSVKKTVEPRHVAVPKEQHETELTRAVNDTSVDRLAPPKKPEPKVTVFKYEVQDGDNLGRILEKHYGLLGKKESTVQVVVNANKLDNRDLIQVGKVLTLPDLSKGISKTDKDTSFIADLINKVTKKKPEVKKPEVKKPVKMERREYKVKAGECLSEIASKQCGTIKFVDEIVKLNKLDDADDIVEGKVLKLPPVQLGK